MKPDCAAQRIAAADVKRLAWECGFELAGIARAAPNADFGRYLHWSTRGLAGAMSYLSDRRAAVRADPRNLLPTARSVVCVGKLYNGPQPRSTQLAAGDRGWISRYAWGADYHSVLRGGLERLVEKLRLRVDFDWKICVDTAPLLERSYARDAGLGWIGKNTCLINQHAGSWIFLGELLTSLELDPDTAPPGRCGTCTRCIDACPTTALKPSPDGGYELDATLCISYFTIELRGDIPARRRDGIGVNIFGCDICQDVCPWNARAAMTLEPDFTPRELAPPLERMAALSEDDFRNLFRDSPVCRSKYVGFLRNVAVAMGNSGSPELRAPLEQLANHPDAVVAEHARWGVAKLDRRTPPALEPF